MKTDFNLRTSCEEERLADGHVRVQLALRYFRPQVQHLGSSHGVTGSISRYRHLLPSHLLPHGEAGWVEGDPARASWRRPRAPAGHAEMLYQTNKQID